MSFSVGIHLWIPAEAGEQFEKFRGVLECTPTPVKYREFDGSELTPKRFNRVQVFDHCFAEVLDRKIETNGIEDVLALLEGYRRPDICYVVGSIFNFLDYDQEKDEIYTSAGPLDVAHYGPEYCLGGSYYKTRGPFQLSFSNAAVFMADRAVESLRDNYNEVVTDLAKRIIAETDPIHLVVCTESEVHPLTAHSIYHRHWQDFFSDLIKIAQLHEQGGVYFSELTEDDPAFVPARKSTMDYGYLRGRFGDNSAAAFVMQLQPLVDKLLQNDGELPNSRSSLDKYFADLKFTTAEKLNKSYLLTALGSPFSYLEEPYFKLFSLVA